MLQYVNAFSCAYDDVRNSVVIHFKQNEPIVVGSGETQTIENVENDVVSIIVDMDLAKNLSNAICYMGGNNNEKEKLK